MRRFAPFKAIGESIESFLDSQAIHRRRKIIRAGRSVTAIPICSHSESTTLIIQRLSSAVLVFALAACTTADIVPMGTDIYMISQTSAGGIFTNMGTLKSEVIQRANAFAEGRGKVAIPVAAKEQPPFPGRMPNYEYQFRLVDRNDPRASGGGLIKTPDMVIENRGQASTVVVNPPSTEARATDVYTELLKLDDLRKRGIVSEAEFDAQKKRLLESR